MSFSSILHTHPPPLLLPPLTVPLIRATAPSPCPPFPWHSFLALLFPVAAVAICQGPAPWDTPAAANRGPGAYDVSSAWVTKSHNVSFTPARR